MDGTNRRHTRLYAPLRAWITPAALACIVLLTALASAAWAARVLVTTDDGRQIEGRLIHEDKASVTLDVAGLPTAFDRSHVIRIQKLPSIEQIYRTRRAKLKDNDLQGRYRLAYFLYKHQADALALKELNDLADRFPKSDQVQTLRLIVLDDLIAQNQAGRPATQPTGPSPSPANQPRTSSQTQPTTSPTTQPWPVSLNRRLTEAQINRIKVYEVNLSTKPLVMISPAAIDRFLQQYAGTPGVPDTRRSRDAFRRLRGYQQLALFFRVRARDFYGDARVVGDPASLRAFHYRIQTSYVTNYCGAAKCHGGTTPTGPVGGLYLFTAQAGSDRTTYTDFYILNHYANKRGKMINREQPVKSLFLQYGLPVNDAQTPHPPVPGWRAYFHGVHTPGFHSFTKFIASLYKPAPDYGITYKIPMPTSAAATTQPTAPLGEAPSQNKPRP